jgi:hypothetical protein
MTDDRLTDDELREMVRASIAKIGGGPVRRETPAAVLHHASFARLPLAAGGDGDGACLIEPAVRCNHCGYCQSYGH